MSVSVALEKSARDFCSKYNCNFDFSTFESRVEEFTFLRPVGGWVDVYKMMFARMYKQALESVANVKESNLDGETMLDDFEYTLIRPYVKESEKEIKHRPYVGMDTISRLEYLTQLTKEAPSNAVELCEEKYKNGDISIKQMMDDFALNSANSEYYKEISVYVQALENANKSRSWVWRVVHPLKNSAEKRKSTQMKTSLTEGVQGGEELYREASAAAYKTFEGHQRLNANLEQSIKRAREDINRTQKMKDVMLKSIRERSEGENEINFEKNGISVARERIEVLAASEIKNGVTVPKKQESPKKEEVTAKKIFKRDFL